MVRSIRCLATPAMSRRGRVAGRIAMLLLWWLGATQSLSAQQPDARCLHHGVMPPGAIGSQQLQHGGPLPEYYQPVEIKAPSGALISLATAGQFDRPSASPRQVGLLVGAVYRLCVMNVRLAEGQEVFPTIEVIDRLYAPPGQESRFPIPIELTEEDLKLAIDGKFVTRVIYVEDPRNALPTRDDPRGPTWFDAAPGQDPLKVANGMGRPVAILRLGGRLPDQGTDAAFYFGLPTFINYASDQAKPAAPSKTVSSAMPFKTVFSKTVSAETAISKQPVPPPAAIQPRKEQAVPLTALTTPAQPLRERTTAPIQMARREITREQFMKEQLADERLAMQQRGQTPAKAEVAKEQPSGPVLILPPPPSRRNPAPVQPPPQQAAASSNNAAPSNNAASSNNNVADLPPSQTPPPSTGDSGR